MNPKLSKRFSRPGRTGTRRISLGSEYELDANRFAKTSVRDQAALLLSIADIAKSEIGVSSSSHHHVSFSDLWVENDPPHVLLPTFPILSANNENDETTTPLTPRLADILSYNNNNNRIRSVSIDASHHVVGRTTSPPCSSTVDDDDDDACPAPTITPLHSPRSTRCSTNNCSTNNNNNNNNKRGPLRGRRKASQRLKAKSKEQQQILPMDMDDDDQVDDSTPITATTSRAVVSSKENPSTQRPHLQGGTPQGVAITKIMRRKFSWKNYPELEHFLVVNRDEYLRHSALNYTMQQKHYNNRLTDRLLELATEHAYVFDEAEFSFVTVRDRIRCYYKSFVQSAKKKGILMGYAARKAGLLTQDDLENSVGTVGHIVTPMDE